MACNTQQTYPTALLQQMARSLCSIVNEGLPDYSIWAANVKRFGAVGNGVTDDRAAIVAAIDSVAATGGVVYFPPGRYYTSSSIPIPYSIGITLQGTGVGSEVLSLSAAEGNKFAITGSNVTIQGLKLNGGYSGGGQAGDFGLISIADCANTIIRGCFITGSGHRGIRITGLATDVGITDNIFSNNFCSISTYSTSNTTAPQRLLITLNKFQENWGSGGETGGIKIQTNPGDTSTSSGHVISLNTFQATGQMGVELWKKIKDSSLVGNTITDCDFGISLDNVECVSVAGNTIARCSYVGIENSFECEDVVVSGNNVSCYDSAGVRAAPYGLLTSNVTGNRISFVGNKVRGCAGRGIQIQNTDYVSCVGNQITDCDVLLYVKDSSYFSAKSNELIGPCGYHVFIDATGGDQTDIDFSGQNKLIGHADSDNFIIYDDGGGFEINRLTIIGNNVGAATSGNLSINFNIPVSRLPYYIIQGNYFIPGGCQLPDQGDYAQIPSPFIAALQEFSIPVATQWEFAVTASGSERWYKIAEWSEGAPLVLNVHILCNFEASENKLSSQRFFVAAAPYAQDSSIMKYPDGDFQGGPLKGFIYNNVGGTATHQLWLRFAAIGAGAVTVALADYFEAAITSPVAVTTEPTWGPNKSEISGINDHNSMKAEKFTAANLKLTGLPTSSVGLDPGEVWVDGVTLKVA